jgi:hypothetical protein
VTTSARVHRLAALLERRYSPRATMLAVVIAAGATGFLISALLLWSGLRSMPLRYALACAAGYAAFLGLMTWWLRRPRATHDRASIVETAADIIDVPDPVIRGTSRSSTGAGEVLFGGGRSGGAGASSAFEVAGVAPARPPNVVPTRAAGSSELRFDMDNDLGKLLLPILAVAAIVVAFGACASVVWQAPHLLAEVIVDAAVSGGAYGRLRTLKTDWTFGVFRRTWVPALLITVLFVGLGWACQFYAPEADSIGDVFRS